MINIQATLKSTLIYVFRINDDSHQNCLKVGEASYNCDEILPAPNSEILNQAAYERIKEYTQTAGVEFELLYTEATLYKKDNQLKNFNDKQVHDVLERSGVKRKVFKDINATEWFETDLETVKKAIAAAKEEQSALKASEVTQGNNPIVLRPEQQEAIRCTQTRFKKGTRMLWNAKMRFGKTLSALQLIKEENYTRTLILTHEPVVNEGWFTDFKKIFYDRPNFSYGSKATSFTHAEQEQKAQKGEKYIYFASMQDLRGSEQVGGNFDKNQELFATPWDLIIVDEAHEGTQTQLGQEVMKQLNREGKTKWLYLSGTPFNLLDGYQENEIYTWDYVMEQKAKKQWDIDHLGDGSNPYAGLPTLNFYTYNLGKLLSYYQGEEDDKAFNFREFFRTQGSGNDLHFVHEADVQSLLDLMCNECDSQYPYSNKEFRRYFSHTLWMVPGVKEAAALSALLQKHPIFQLYKIVNVAGEGDPDDALGNQEALKAVNAAISNEPDQTRTITLSCGRLTTGVSVPAWTAVLMLSGSYSTQASSYMQTIFRVQTPYEHNGLRKEECYVFDFAPDRTLKVIAETAKVSAKAGGSQESDQRILGEFLNYCPVIAIEGGEMKPYDTPHLLDQLKRVYVEHVVNNGFEDGYLYSDQLKALSEDDVLLLQDVKGIIGATPAMASSNDIDINHQGLDQEQHAGSDAPHAPKRAASAEEQAQKEAHKKMMEQRHNAISILRGISIRMPLMIYGAEVNDEQEGLTLDNFADQIDDESWLEFMPKGITKEIFASLKRYYDADIFRAASHRLREMVREADKLPDLRDRIARIAQIFATFRNPDKETVLTPWPVVNEHLSSCLGGYCFTDTDPKSPTYRQALDKPKHVNVAKITREVFRPYYPLLEINSKSGLYPLYLAYSIFIVRYSIVRGQMGGGEVSEEQNRILWNTTLSKNIFVVCKTPMACSITRRTLAGFSGAPVNVRYYKGLIDQLKEDPQVFIDQVRNGKDYWNANNDKKMKFEVVVGNPPYQEEGLNTRKAPIYHLFYDAAIQLGQKVTLITPGRFLFKAGQTPKDWMEKMLNDPHFEVIKYFKKSADVFPTVDIKGGIAITYYDKDYTFEPIGCFSEYPELQSILQKVTQASDFKKGAFSEIISFRGMYRFTDAFFEENPEATEYLRKGTGNMITSNTFNLYPAVFTPTKPEDGEAYLQLYGRANNERTLRWVKQSYVQPNPYLNTYNVFVPKANGSGAIGEVLSTPIIGQPIIGHTDTFMSIGQFPMQAEAEACLNYVKTKFARTLLGTLKVTQDNPRDTWENVPLQNFTTKSDIDWKQSVAEIDRQLYKKYDLDKEEIDFIEKMIKPME